MGWSTSVISADPYGYERFDPDLLAIIPDDAEIVRVRGRDLWQAVQAWRGKRIQKTISTAAVEVVDQVRAAQHKPVRSMFRKAVRMAEVCFYQPDIAKPWIRPAVSGAVKLYERKRPDVNLGVCRTGVGVDRGTKSFASHRRTVRTRFARSAWADLL